MISFIIRTKNEEYWVGHCIQSIIENFSNEEKIEIKVIDNESKDDTLQIVKMFREYNIEVLTIPKTEYTPGKALNLGLRSVSSSSDFACLISAHCVVDKIDLDLLRSHFIDNNCFGVLGRQKPVYKGKILKSKYVWENFVQNESNVIKNLRENIEGNSAFFHNAFSFINMNVWRQHKFDENVTGKEDRLWANHLLKKNYYFLYDSSQVCVHHWTSNCATWSGLE
tara:strand:+ start:602 stop:1273 length:672 start_codon:yes stop_codon:yes gene_type:complete